MIGYSSDKKCVVCSCTPSTIEPRFGYAVCKNHENVSPVEISNMKNAKSILTNGMILKGDDCPFKDDCKFIETACNGEGCPFKYRTEHLVDFSCGTARLFDILERREKK